MPNHDEPMSMEDSQRVGLLAGQAFSPSAPITHKEVFAGRTPQIHRVVDAINQAGQSVLIYGERGVGKTSLANVMDDFYLSISNQRIFAPHITCDGDDVFHSIWMKVIGEKDRKRPTASLSDQCMQEIDNVVDDAEGSLTPHCIRSLAETITQTHLFIPIIDEFDRVEDEVSIRLFTDTIKALSDHSRSTTIILVGVGDTIDDLISEHESVERALVQVLMPRMDANESIQILDNSVPTTGVSFSEDARNMIVAIAQGLPHYTHSLGLYAVREAASDRCWIVDLSHVERAIEVVIENSQQSLKRAYHTATSSPRPEAIHRQVLLACTMATTDTLGYFAPSDIKDRLSRILSKEAKYGTFSSHLTDFSTEERGNILQQTGKDRRFRYRFRNPLIQPFIIMRGLKDGLIVKADIDGLFRLSG
ncbi:MAG: AAA family ATPase [Planctomycetota bacterium]